MKYRPEWEGGFLFWRLLRCFRGYAPRTRRKGQNGWRDDGWRCQKALSDQDCPTEETDVIAEEIDFLAEEIDFLTEEIDFLTEEMDFLCEEINFPCEGIDFLAQEIDFLPQDRLILLIMEP